MQVPRVFILLIPAPEPASQACAGAWSSRILTDEVKEGTGLHTGMGRTASGNDCIIEERSRTWTR